jgi:hypothetical protein
VLYVAFGLPAMLEGCMPAQRPAAITNVLGWAAIATVVNIALVWLAARKRSNVARWLFLVFAVTGGPLLFKDIIVLANFGFMARLAAMLSVAMDVFGAMMVFSRDARGWFR